MISITGDTHGDFRRFNSSNFPEEKEMSRDDFVLIAGDFGGIWTSDKPHPLIDERRRIKSLKNEAMTMRWFEQKRPTFCFVLGNHENYNRYDSEEFPVVDFLGGKAQQLADNVFHLMSGYVFEMCEKKLFTFDGASSHDITDGILLASELEDSKEEKDYYAPEYLNEIKEKYYIDCKNERVLKSKRKQMLNDYKLFRVKDTEWWERECMPTKEETERGIENLKKSGNKVDFVLTHCLPQSVASVISHGVYKPNPVTTYLEHINQTTDVGNWICGHYHENKTIMGKYHIIYEQITRIA